ncbi:DUF1592 domain-containing protein [Sandaracinus amylolyticus]|nr:DUF1592 domain-containing protein [Sandaracinus amylolyticus]
MRTHLALTCALALTGACSGALDDAPAGPSGTSRTPPGPGATSTVASVSGARRLSQAELDRTLFDLLGDDTRPARRLLAEDEYAPYDNDYTLQRASRALIESLEALAEDVGTRAVANPAVMARIVPCTPASDGDEACFRAFVASFVGQALRRPPSDDDVDRYLPLLAFATEDNPYVDNDFSTAVDLVIRAVIQDPEFLYRIEVGERTDDAGVFTLGDHEIATRMAYLLWGTTPDATLLADAAAGRLRTGEGRRAIAERMMEDERAREQVRRFHAMWLGYRSIPHSAERVAQFDRETSALIDRVVFDEARAYTDLFASDETFVDAALATHYGLPAPSDPAGAWVRYPEGSGRAGILAHGSVLAAFSKFTDTSPTQRGIFVRTRLMCDAVAPPPPTVDVDQPPGGDGGDALCKSERYAAHSDMSSSCGACHAQFDPIGFGLERFDISGRVREHDEGRPECAIDGVGELPGVGAFSGPAELGAMLIAEGEIDDCVVRQVWEFAVGRDAMTSERAAIDATVARFRENGRSMRGLLIDLVASERFALRAEE